MLLDGRNAQYQPANDTIELRTVSQSAMPTRRLGILRAGIATALIALTIVAGIAHPAETSAQKSTSFTCTTLETMFDTTSNAYSNAIANGLNNKANRYLSTTNWLERMYLDLGCNVGSADLGNAA